MAKTIPKPIIICGLVGALMIGINCGKQQEKNAEAARAAEIEASTSKTRSEMVWYVVGQQNPTNVHSYKPITGARGFNVKFPYDSTNRPSIKDIEARWGRLPTNQQYFILTEEQKPQYGLRSNH